MLVWGIAILGPHARVRCIHAAGLATVLAEVDGVEVDHQER